MINKEVITKTQKRLIRINMLVVSGFLILLCMFTPRGVRFIKFSSYFYFSRSGNEENPEENYMAIGMLFGVAIGTIFFNAESRPYGICFGMLFGMVIGMSIKKK